jgi:hypothetical protein
VKGAQQADVVAALKELGRRAQGTPETSGWIVYHQQTDDFGLSIPESLVPTLSTRLSSTALASCPIHDEIKRRLWKE